jgi:membrane-associated phospholipid phosphatase
MGFRLALILAAALSAQQFCAGQDTAPSAPAPDATPTVVVPATPAPATVAPATPAKGIYRDWWKQLGPNVVRDQKPIWLFPISAARGHHLKPTIALVGVTAALIGLDKYSTGYFNRTNSFQDFNRAFSGPNTALGMELVPAVLYVIGLARRDVYAQKTFFLAGRAVIDSEILTTVMKDIDRRSVPSDGDFSNTWFNKKGGNYFRGVGSFPSGHTIAAFAVATVYANRYPNPRWRRWMIYGLAGLVGFSRVSIHAHYPADVFAGAALGYVIARYQVLGHP